ncbi:hypothetical protein M7I_3437 [Glarea lozoyensis 74030]|uniref:Uncharacterized protein n=1 Tax=Glarea lozoyensis (strain ATCC 74030 / MF5533) TaxID=1104152 RepID=H0ELH3_GLAL7|nr:hypothetical protein M7I_3437 [Glarea lozoyensis 74030]
MTSRPCVYSIHFLLLIQQNPTSAICSSTGKIIVIFLINIMFHQHEQSKIIEIELVRVLI